MSQMNEPLISRWLDVTKKQAMIEKALEEMLKKKSQLSASEYYALYYLSQNGQSMRLNDLGNCLSLSQSALSRLIKRLEEKEAPLIGRKTCSDDKRGIYVGLTEAGKKELRSVQQDISVILEEYFKSED